MVLDGTSVSSHQSVRLGRPDAHYLTPGQPQVPRVRNARPLFRFVVRHKINSILSYRGGVMANFASAACLLLCPRPAKNALVGPVRFLVPI